MKKPNLDTIENLLADVREQFLFLKDADTEADPLDVELFEATVNFLAANVSVFRKTFVSAQPVVSLAATAVPETEVAPPELVEEPVFIPEPVAVSEPVYVPQEPIAVPPVDPDPVTWQEEVDPEPVAEEHHFKSEMFSWEKESQTISEEVHEVEEEIPAPVTPLPEQPVRPLSINEILANQRKTSAATAGRLEGGRITDLKSAISLNDKLLFIKDLFNGYSLAYSEAVELLNRYDSFEEADTFLQTNYAAKNQWQSKPETVDKLYVILRRRYMPA